MKRTPSPLSPWQKEVLEGANRKRSAEATPHVVAQAREALNARNLSESQRKALELRIAHPGLTLTELAALHEPPLTKSALWSRIRMGFRNAEPTRRCHHCKEIIPKRRERCTCSWFRRQEVAS